MKYKEIHFEDKGQDFLFWVINENNVVVDSQPFQAGIWCGAQLLNVKIGNHPIIINEVEPMTLNYRILKIEEPKEIYEFWQYPDNREKRLACRGELVT